MSLQARGFRWSVGVHAIFLCAVVALKALPVLPEKIAVIDFDLSAARIPQPVEQPRPVQAPAAVRRLNGDVPRQPPPALIASNASPQESVAETPSHVSPSGEKTTGASSSAAGGPETAAGRPVQSVEGQAAGPGGVGPAGPDESRTIYLKEHFAHIRDRINRGISYPPLARKMGWCGRVKVAFTVCEDGGVNEVKILDSSGFSLLDRNAVETVRKVAPFPRPPVKAEIRMVISYLLK